MTIATLSWPEASLYIAAITGAAVVLSVLIWSIFMTGQAAIRTDNERSGDRR